MEILLGLIVGLILFSFQRKSQRRDKSVNVKDLTYGERYFAIEYQNGVVVNYHRFVFGLVDISIGESTVVYYKASSLLARKIIDEFTAKETVY